MLDLIGGGGSDPRDEGKVKGVEPQPTLVSCLLTRDSPGAATNNDFAHAVTIPRCCLYHCQNLITFDLLLLLQLD